MGTHPIFESDFDCLTECFVSPPEPFPFPPPADRSTPSRPSSSTRFESTRPDPKLKVSSTVVLLSLRRVLTFRSDSPEPTEVNVETWTFPRDHLLRSRPSPRQHRWRANHRHRRRLDNLFQLSRSFRVGRNHYLLDSTCNCTCILHLEFKITPRSSS